MCPKNSFFPFLLFALLCSGLLAQDAGLRLSAPPVEKLLREDRANGWNRFAAALPVSVVPAAAHYTEGENGDYVWSYTFTVTGAYGISLLLEGVVLRERSHLSFRGSQGDGKRFSANDVSAAGRIYTRFEAGESVTLTYRGVLPDAAPFRVVRVDHAYRKAPFLKGFGDSDACQVNANCPAGDDWADEKAGACRIEVIVAEGAGFCSGNLINNTARDGRPLLLTGFHCMDGFTPMYDVWAFDFDYRSSGCDDPATEPTPTTYAGCVELAGQQESDYLLLELTDPDFVAEDHYFAGWDRSDGGVSGVVTHLHHPQGDIQKIGQTGGNGMRILGGTITWNNDLITPARHHFTLDYAVGSFQPGSSGSAFFDADHRIRGQLNGGNLNCPGTSQGFVGRLFQSWNYGIGAFLDPLGQEPTTLDGENLLTKRFVAGSGPEAGIQLVFDWQGGGQTTAVTDAAGNYRAERPTDVAAFTATLSYPGGAIDEKVDILDIISIRRHILGLDTLSPVAQLAADVNGSGTIRTSDIIAVTRVVLAQQDWGERPNWIVLPVNFPLDPLPTEPEAPIGIQLNTTALREIPLDVYLIKTGDASTSQ